MGDSLKGRIEVVQVRGQLGQSRCAYGTIKRDGCKVMVNYAANYKGQDVLARFALNSKPPHRICNFLTDKIPAQFRGLPAEDYILCGIWEDRMESQSLVPDLEEIQEYYPPGDLSVVYYLKKKRDDDLYRIDSRSIRPFEVKNLSVLVERKLPDPRKAARLILAEDKHGLGSVVSAIAREQVSSMMMKPIR